MVRSGTHSREREALYRFCTMHSDYVNRHGVLPALCKILKRDFKGYCPNRKGDGGHDCCIYHMAMCLEPSTPQACKEMMS